MRPPVLEGVPNPIYERSDDDDDHIFGTDSETGEHAYSSRRMPYRR